MRVLVVVHIRDAGEPRAQRLRHGGCTNRPTAPRIGAARHLQHAILAEKAHDAVEIVVIEGVENGLKRFDGGLVCHGDLLSASGASSSPRSRTPLASRSGNQFAAASRSRSPCLHARLAPIAAQRLVHITSSAILSEEDFKLRPNPQLLAIDAWHRRYDLVIPTE